ncbi:MAG: DUF2585 family protein [Candidatus Promineifilaceae bacterium]
MLKAIEDPRWRTAAAMFSMFLLLVIGMQLLGHSAWGPTGSPGFWSGDTNSSENSQRLLDAYSFTHVVHGYLLYWLLYLLSRRVKMTMLSRFTWAVFIEVIWELFENTEFVINRYRTATLSLDYYGDSILNSVGDVLNMMIGFGLASTMPVAASILIVLTFEVGLFLWIADNLILNIIQLVYPVDWLREWQQRWIEGG